MGLTYFKRWGFSINEGGKYANIHMNWAKRGVFLYVCVGFVRVTIGVGDRF